MGPGYSDLFGGDQRTFRARKLKRELEHCQRGLMQLVANQQVPGQRLG
jgi:hypothetical protein